MSGSDTPLGIERSADDGRVVLPGGTIGILGSGQLGRMCGIAARQMGYGVQTFSPESGTPTGHVADREWVAGYDDLDAIEQFARSVDVVTLEFENIATAATDAAARHVPVRPGGHVLHTTQNRLREKRFLQRLSVPITPFAQIRSAADIDAAIETAGLPGILKTASWGYDGKGQQNVDTAEEVAAVVQQLAGNVTDARVAEAEVDEESAGLVLERRVDLAKEISVVAARGIDGEVVCYAPFENRHSNHILDVTLSPASITLDLADEAEACTRRILKALGAIGTICVEYFVSTDGRLLVNEIAPRPHNSGHVTIDGHATSQFEQQVRAVCGLPLGDVTPRRPAAMVNLLGDLWSGREPHWLGVLDQPDVHLHLYGKAEPKPGRKMGHVSAVAASLDEAERLATGARQRLSR